MDKTNPKKQNPDSDNPQPSTSTSSPAPTERLMSFLSPRNLLLGSNDKKLRGAGIRAIPAPNLKVQRKKVEDSTPADNESGSGKNKGKGRGRGRGRGSDRGRGRGRGKSNAVQSVGIFAEGIQIDARPSSSGGRSSYGGGSGSIEIPTLKLDYDFDKDAEDRVLEKLLKDDFIDDGDDDDYDYDDIENAPIALPLIRDTKGKQSLKKIKAEPGCDDDERRAIEPMAVDEPEEERDIKPTILENGVAVPPSELKPKLTNKFVPPPSDNSTQQVQQVIKQSGLMMLRFPDCLPGFPKTEENAGPSSEEHQALTGSDDQSANILNNITKLCTLRDLQPGVIGKLQILKSGKARLVLGENSLVVEVGSRIGFRQDIIAAKINDENKEMINLGPVDSTLICTPDFENMLNRLNLVK
ncbi:GSCOCG00003642001-RA-CDS [Cotesia congregata]|nr:GSCOCG00003642001-RA-CDS [Cotesia congregata]